MIDGDEFYTTCIVCGESHEPLCDVRQLFPISIPISKQHQDFAESVAKELGLVDLEWLDTDGRQVLWGWPPSDS